MDKKTIIRKMKEGTDVYAKERAVLEENENERATLSLRQSLKKNTVTELEGWWMNVHWMKVNFHLHLMIKGEAL